MTRAFTRVCWISTASGLSQQKFAVRTDEEEPFTAWSTVAPRFRGAGELLKLIFGTRRQPRRCLLRGSWSTTRSPIWTGRVRGAPSEREPLRQSWVVKLRSASLDRTERVVKLRLVFLRRL